MTNPPERMFYIYSIKWTEFPLVTWWCPDNRGYTTDLSRAGKYSESQVRADKDYYDDGQNARAVPCDVAESQAGHCVAYVNFPNSFLTEEPTS